MLDPFLKSLIVCPRDLRTLEERGDTLVCSANHIYPVVEDIPILLRDDVPATYPEYTRALNPVEREYEIKEAKLYAQAKGVDPLVAAALGASSGSLYKGLINNLKAYPIPQIRLPTVDNNQILLDIGCMWGRWTIAAMRRGYAAIGIAV